MSEIISGTTALNVLSSDAWTAAAAMRRAPSSPGWISAGVSPTIALMKPSMIACAPAFPSPARNRLRSWLSSTCAPNSPLRTGAAIVAMMGRNGSSNSCIVLPMRSAVSRTRRHASALAPPSVSRLAMAIDRLRPPADRSPPAPAASILPIVVQSSSFSAGVWSGIVVLHFYRLIRNGWEAHDT
jgi:hypothetical protein